MPLQVEVVSPERILYSGEAEMVICRTEDGGEIAFLTGHVPFLGSLTAGTVRVKPVGAPEVSATVDGGFVEVRDDKVSVLVEGAELTI